MKVCAPLHRSPNQRRLRIPNLKLIEKQVEGAKEFIEAVEGLIVLFERAATESNSNFGLWKADGDLGLADVMAGPCEFNHCHSTLNLHD